MQKHKDMNIIDIILAIWIVAVGVLVLFIMGERSVSKWPDTSFAKWWRQNIASLMDKDNEQF